jgi:hypothetical protein
MSAPSGFGAGTVRLNTMESNALPSFAPTP